MYGQVKMRDGERICNLSVFVVQRNHIMVEIMKYMTQSRQLEVDYAKLDTIIWPGKSRRMPASETARFKRMNYVRCCLSHPIIG